MQIVVTVHAAHAVAVCRIAIGLEVVKLRAGDDAGSDLVGREICVDDVRNRTDVCGSYDESQRQAHAYPVLGYPQTAAKPQPLHLRRIDVDAKCSELRAAPDFTKRRRRLLSQPGVGVKALSRAHCRHELLARVQAASNDDHILKRLLTCRRFARIEQLEDRP